MGECINIMNPSIVHLILCHNRCSAFVLASSLPLPVVSSSSLSYSLIPNICYSYNHCGRRRNTYTRLLGSTATGAVVDDDFGSSTKRNCGDCLNWPMSTTITGGDGGTMYKVKKNDDASYNDWIHVSFDVADDTTASFAQQGKGQKKRKGVNNNNTRPSSSKLDASPHQLHDAGVKTTVNNIKPTLGESASTPAPTSSSSSSIPESVLQYERQMRKLRASDRASKTNVNIQDHLHTVHVDEHVVVVNKPSGILCVPGVNGHRSMLDLVFDAYGYGGVGATAEEDAAITTTSESGGVHERQSKVSSNDTVTSPPLSRDSMIVHRLDMDTSGIVIFARTRTAMAKLHESFRDRTGAKKVYEALLVGWLEIDKWIDGTHTATTASDNNNDGNDDANMKLQYPLGGGEIHLPLQRDHKHPPFMRVSTPESEAEARQAVLDLNNAGYAKLMAKRPKPSTTHFHILSHELWMGRHPVTRVQLLPITGRTHQLRVHCAALGHPILGDPAYGYCGEAHANGGFGEVDLCRVSPTFASLDLRRDVEETVRESGRTMCLHARKLTLDHPVTNDSVTFEVAPTF